MRYPEIAKRFQLILDLRKMKARDLADKSGLTEAAISHFVHGNRCPNNKTAYVLGKILNCSPAWLMDLGFAADCRRCSAGGCFQDARSQELADHA